MCHGVIVWVRVCRPRWRAERHIAINCWRVREAMGLWRVESRCSWAAIGVGGWTWIGVSGTGAGGVGGVLFGSIS